MKRAFSLFLTFGLFASVCPAGQTPGIGEKGVTTQSALKTTDVKSIKGKVKSVTLVDPLCGIKPEIAVIGDDGKRYIISVMLITTIYDIEWNASTLDKISKNQLVKVKYTVDKEGFREALSISSFK
jgi:hypothetical protein